jgi:hypothetical protein
MRSAKWWLTLPMFKHSSDLGVYSMERVTNWPAMTAVEKRKGCPTGASRTVQRGAETAVWLATLPDSGPTGGFFRDRKTIPW